MKYLIRSVKYFFYFVLLLAVIILFLVLTGMADGNIETMFRGGYYALVNMGIAFAVIAAIYPSVGFIRRKARIAGEWDVCKAGIREFLESHGYVLEKDSADCITFRRKGVMGRLTRMYEDRITITPDFGGVEVEGLRKDIVRIVFGIENYFRNNSEE